MPARSIRDALEVGTLVDCDDAPEELPESCLRLRHTPNKFPFRKEVGGNPL